MPPNPLVLFLASVDSSPRFAPEIRLIISQQAVVFILLVIFTSTIYADSMYIVYNTSERIIANKLNVHLVPHTHDNVGWLKTVDRYYGGSNNLIQGPCVQNILDSVVEALLADKNRKFIYVEMAIIFSSSFNNVYGFTCMHFSNVGGMTKANGGMCIHDEAAPHYIDMIDQTTLGHRFIKREFGQTPRIGWQIDPFEHSAVQDYLLGSEIDYQDRAKQKSEKRLEVAWHGSKTFGSSAQDGCVNALYSTPSIYTGSKYATKESWPIKTDDFFP
ncbi:hypothetical protein GIB67_021450 [Kingdonia uniflora]|uniref:Glycoside hydrolase family 38 N-terminal domain-containing protein n=1 Tax=Kingdonia uniflora TaxID=39325 RepID=A0A7J7NQF7_9MAGN|nr:hypothetical protein GIB67_021450 [Kingdonia uniflora]